MSVKTISIAHSAVNAKLVNPTREDRLIVQQLLSYRIDGADHMSLGEWDGRTSFFDFQTGTFPAGFVIRVYRAFKAAGYVVNLMRRPLPEPVGPAFPVVDSFAEDPRYDYQRQVPDLVLRYGQVVAQVATGGGKSRICKLTHARIARPTLFLTTRGILMHQMRDTFIADMKIDVGVFGDDAWSEIPELMNVGMVQTFAARLELKTVKSEVGALVQRRQVKEGKEVEKLRAQLTKAKADPVVIQRRIVALLDGLQRSYPPAAETMAEIQTKVASHELRRLATVELLKNFEVLILEEAHEASSDSYYDITKLCINAHYRLALTGTPFMKDSEQANMRLEACSGPVAITVSELMLIQRGILAKPYFRYITDRGLEGECQNAAGEQVTRKLYQSTPYQAAYEIGISGSVSRNKHIVTEVSIAKAHGLSSLVLVQHKAHGRRLEQLMTRAGIRATFIEGLHTQAQRKSALDDLKSGAIDCLVGSTILDVGVDCPAVGLVVLAGAGKAEVAVRQRIGRGLREKKNGGPNVCFIVDFVDPVNNHLRDHARERRQIVASTPGFAEGVVSAFPYEALGFVQKAA